MVAAPSKNTKGPVFSNMHGDEELHEHGEHHVFQEPVADLENPNNDNGGPNEPMDMECNIGNPNSSIPDATTGPVLNSQARTNGPAHVTSHNGTSCVVPSEGLATPISGPINKPVRTDKPNNVSLSCDGSLDLNSAPQSKRRRPVSSPSSSNSGASSGNRRQKKKAAMWRVVSNQEESGNDSRATRPEINSRPTEDDESSMGSSSVGGTVVEDSINEEVQNTKVIGDMIGFRMEGLDDQIKQAVMEDGEKLVQQ